MNKHTKSDNLDINRRDFVAGTGGLTFAFSVGGFMTAKPSDVEAAANRANINGWVTIGTDNIISIASPAPEMGQGVYTSIPMVVAEELDADWAQVRAFVPPPIPKKFGNPGFGGFVIAVASRTTSGYWDKIRMHGAEVRRVLLEAVAIRWSVPVEDLSTEPSMVVHKKSGKKISYGEIAKFAKAPKEMPKLTPADLKKTSDFRIIGQDIPRFDVPLKATGKAQYGMDVQVPGMLYAAILRTPQEGGAPDQVDDGAAKKIKGVVNVIKLRNSVAVLGTSVEATQAGKRALEVKWKPGKTAGFNSEKAAPEYAAKAMDTAQAGLPYRQDGDAKQAIEGAAKTVTAQYQSDYAYHAQMEPMNITALVNEAGDGAQLWLGTQAPNLAALVASKVLKTKPQKIRVHQHFLGGGFGRRVLPDLIPDAVVLSKITKKPIKVIWMREDDVASGKLRPMTAHHLEAGLDNDGKVVGWRHRIVGEAVIGSTGPKSRLVKAKGLDPLTLEGAKHIYDIPNQHIEYIREYRNVALAAWRGIGTGYNIFAIEAFLDEIAKAQGVDPVEMRLSMLKKHPRARHVIEETAKMAGWGKKPGDTAMGFTYADVWGTQTAGVAEISVDRSSGKIRVHNFWTSVDPGVAVQPQNIVAQTESNVIYGIGQTLKERISFDDGAIEQSNYHDYQVMRMSEVPEIHTKVISTDNKPTGIGEIALPLVGGAISNAMAALTGKRLRHMPFTPDRVQEALKA